MKTLVCLILVSLLVTGCAREDDAALLPKFSAGTEFIKSGIACGHCSGICTDTLLITPDKLFYKRVIWGEGEPKSEIIEQSFSQQGWQNLLGLVELSAFSELNLESCARCADGCDHWVEIKTGGVDNLVSFPWNNFPAEVDSLTKALNSIKEQLNSP